MFISNHKFTANEGSESNGTVGISPIVIIIRVLAIKLGFVDARIEDREGGAMFSSSSSWNHRIRPIFLRSPLRPLAPCCRHHLLPSAAFFSAGFLSPSSSVKSLSPGKSIIWMAHRVIELRPCDWWKSEALTEDSIVLLLKCCNFANENQWLHYADCYGSLSQMRCNLCDDIGIAHLLNATLVLLKLEVAAYWNESK